MDQPIQNQAVHVKLVPGEHAPTYSGMVSEMKCEEVVITEQGTESGLPIVDFVLEDRFGNRYLLVLSGRIVNAISAAVKGVNVRNHGKEEP